ncbi:alpha/beta hydrolase [soil metagenome]
MPIVRLHDIDAYYERQGRGPALVLLHGLGSNCHDWDPHLAALSAEFCAIAPDLRGFGQTPMPPGPYSIQRLADDLAALLDELRVETSHVAGYSLGAAVALQFAHDYAAHVKSLILINGRACCIPGDRRALFERVLRRGVIRCLGPRAAGWLVARRLFPEAGQAQQRAAFAERYAGTDKRAYLAALDALVDWAPGRCIDEIDEPTLLIASTSGGGPQTAALATKLPKAELRLVPEVCQGTPYDSSGTLRTLMLDFLRSVR